MGETITFSAISCPVCRAGHECIRYVCRSTHTHGSGFSCAACDAYFEVVVDKEIGELPDTAIR